MSSSSLPLPRTSVIFQPLADGAVLFNPEDEIYFGLNQVGVMVWEALSSAESGLDCICDLISAKYPDVPAETVRQDVTDLLAELEREKLVTPR